MSPEDRQLLKDLNNRLTRIERNLGGLANDTRQIEVIKKVITGEDLKVKSLTVKNTLTHQGVLHLEALRRQPVHHHLVLSQDLEHVAGEE